jgi:hypothetical protein
MCNLEKARHPVIEPTSVTARLPGLEIEIIHHRPPAGDAERISIKLQAVPSFEAFGRYVETANPFAFWAKAVQMAWLPWVAVAPAAFTPGVSLPPGRLGSDDALCRRRGSSRGGGRRNLSGRHRQLFSCF